MNECPAVLHNYNGARDQMFDHDCDRQAGHSGVHNYTRHHKDYDSGCTWITGRFIIDSPGDMEPE